MLCDGFTAWLPGRLRASRAIGTVKRIRQRFVFVDILCSFIDFVESFLILSVRNIEISRFKLECATESALIDAKTEEFVFPAMRPSRITKTTTGVKNLLWIRRLTYPRSILLHHRSAENGLLNRSEALAAAQIQLFYQFRVVEELLLSHIRSEKLLQHKYSFSLGECVFSLMGKIIAKKNGGRN